MEKGNYICELCYKEYEPTKRGIQRFCSSQCRKKSHYHLKKNKSNLPVIPKTSPILQSNNKKNEIERISLSGVGNSYLGALGAMATIEAGKKFLSHQEPKKEENSINKRFIPVLNIPNGPRNGKPYFDLEKQHLIYEPDPNYNDAADNII